MQLTGAPVGRGIAGRDLHTRNAPPAPAKRTVVAHARRTRTTAPAETSSNGHEPEKNAKAAALLRAISELNSKFGAGTVMRQTDKPVDVPKFSSGCLSLDGILGGGWPRGRVVEVYGPESCGKTTLALHAIAEVQKSGGYAAIIDLEHALDPEYAKRLGVQYGDQLVTAQPNSGEEALDIVDKLAASGAVDVVVVDSVSALLPRMELESDMGQTQVGGQARLMSTATRKLIGTAAKSGCTIMFINQIRHKVGVIYGSNETTSGGVALKFYSSVRVELRKKEAIKSGDDAIGIKVKAKVVKNKVAPPMKETLFDIIFGYGIDAMGSLVDAAERVGVITRKGAWYYMGERRLGQGREKVVESVRADVELQKELQELTRAELSQPEAVLALAEIEDETFEDGDVEEGVAGAVDGTVGYDD